MPDTDNFSNTPHFAVPCDDLDASVALFRDSFGFRLDAIYPADAPRVAIISRPGMTIRLDTALDPGDFRLRLPLDFGEPVRAPGGLVIEPAVDLPPDRVPLVSGVTIIHDTGDHWASGRAGMQYRDLVPGRLGGAFIASHIRVPVGGPVPDYVHHHHVRFQAIYCVAGSARLVYENQGDSFQMQVGDCVLQPPHIRHRVLECSDGFEVIEVGSPAEHLTLVDHDLTLPNGVDPSRRWNGQRFVFHRARNAGWAQSCPGVDVRDTGIADATNGLATVRVCRVSNGATTLETALDAPVSFRFVLDGTAVAIADDVVGESVARGSAIVLPGPTVLGFQQPSADFAWLEVGIDA